MFGLSPPSISRPPPTPTLNPQIFDRHAAYCFSLAFQCVVNISARGSEPIRARVVQVGTLDVIGCMLENWLMSKGFAVGPSACAVQGGDERDEQSATSDTDTSAANTPSNETTTTTTLAVPGRERSGTVVARREWDQQEQTSAAIQRTRTIHASQTIDSFAPWTSTSRLETETEDDSEPDNDVEMTSQDQDTDENVPPLHRTAGIVVDSPMPAGGVGTSDALDVDAHIIVYTNAVDERDCCTRSKLNDDFALGAPPGAPGAIDTIPRTRTNTIPINTRNMNHGHAHSHDCEEMTPRAVLASLPVLAPGSVPLSMPVSVDVAAAAARGGPSNLGQTARASAADATNVATSPVAGPAQAALPAAVTVTPRPSHRHHHHHHHHGEEIGPFREEDLLLSLQLLACLSKYPHVRQAFYKPRLSFHPAMALAQTSTPHPGSSTTQVNPTNTIGMIFAGLAAGRPTVVAHGGGGFACQRAKERLLAPQAIDWARERKAIACRNRF